MEFGVYVHSLDPRYTPRLAQLIEELGFTHAWFSDLPITFGDTYVCMALAALHTRTIRLGTSIAVLPLRTAPVTAHSIATVNALAPGRVILGAGSGSFSRGLMGMAPTPFAVLRAELTAIRGLLRDGEADYENGGVRRKIRFFNRDLRSINLDDQIPLYVGASMPKMALLAGELGDGLISVGNTPEFFQPVLGQVAEGRRRAGRDPAQVPCVCETYVCVLREGETLESSRVVGAMGPSVLMLLRAIAAGVAPNFLPEEAQPTYRAFLDHLGLDAIPAEERHLALWENVHRLPAAERRFVTPDLLRASAIVGTREEVIQQIRDLEEAGVTQIVLSPPVGDEEGYLRDIADALVGRA